MKMHRFALRGLGFLVLWMLHCGSELAAAVPPGQWLAVLPFYLSLSLISPASYHIHRLSFLVTCRWLVRLLRLHRRKSPCTEAFFFLPESPSFYLHTSCMSNTQQQMQVRFVHSNKCGHQTPFHPGDHQINQCGRQREPGRWRSSKPPLLDLDHNNCFLSPQGHKSTMHMILPHSLRSGPATPVLFPCVRWDTSAPHQYSTYHTTRDASSQ